MKPEVIEQRLKLLEAPVKSVSGVEHRFPSNFHERVRAIIEKIPCEIDLVISYDSIQISLGSHNGKYLEFKVYPNLDKIKYFELYQGVPEIGHITEDELTEKANAFMSDIK